MSETHVVKLAAKINKLVDNANIQRIGIPSDLTLRREKFLQFIRTYKCALESFTVTSNILASFEIDGKIHKAYTKPVDQALWKSLYGHIQSVTLDSLHEYHGSGVQMLLALQRKCANIDDDNREFLEDRFKSCTMHKNETATGFLTRLQNYSHKAKQAGAHIPPERFQKVLFYQMKKNPIYKSKAESLETRSQLDKKHIPITVLEQFFSLLMVYRLVRCTTQKIFRQQTSPTK